MRVLKVGIIFSVGFIAGLMLSRVPKINAQVKSSGGIVRVLEVDTSWKNGKSVPDNVVGFACIPGGKNTECYVVTQSDLRN